MQPDYEDFYEMGDEGCCLICPDAKEGCLCFNCKCTKCFHYSPPNGHDDERKGSCDIATSNKAKFNKKSAAISKWAKKDAVDYTRVGLHKHQTKLEA